VSETSAEEWLTENLNMQFNGVATQGSVNAANQVDPSRQLAYDFQSRDASIGS